MSSFPVIISLNIDTQNDNTFMSGNIGKYGFVSMHELCCAWCFYERRHHAPSSAAISAFRSWLLPCATSPTRHTQRKKHDERQHRQERLREYASIMLCLMFLWCGVMRVVLSRWPSVKDDIGKMAYTVYSCPVFVNFDTLNGNNFITLIRVVCNTSLPPCILGTHHPHDDMHINARVRREYCRTGVQTQ